MTLSDYMDWKELRHAEKAKRLGVSREHVTMLLSGARAPSLELAIKIERETGGNVPVAIWSAGAAA